MTREATCPSLRATRRSLRDPDHRFRSTEAGATWNDLGATGAILRGVDPRDPRVLYADDTCGREYATCRSDDGGQIWHVLVVPASSPKYATQFGTLFVADEGALYYAPPRDQGFELDRSDDRGATWRTAVAAPGRRGHRHRCNRRRCDPRRKISTHCALVRSVADKPFVTAFTPPTCEPGSRITGHGHLACAIFGGDQVVASNDDGATWHALALPHAGFEHVEVGPDGARHVAATARFTCLALPDRLLIAAADGLYAIAPPW